MGQKKEPAPASQTAASEYVHVASMLISSRIWGWRPCGLQSTCCCPKSTINILPEVSSCSLEGPNRLGPKGVYAWVQLLHGLSHFLILALFLFPGHTDTVYTMAPSGEGAPAVSRKGRSQTELQGHEGGRYTCHSGKLREAPNPLVWSLCTFFFSLVALRVEVRASRMSRKSCTESAWLAFWKNSRLSGLKMG